ncbi:MAG: hypothetical protein LQ349_004134 [Xanthoria aureola]|nr:MAG: hypothetical protein LQ349_004134 [Xanthoria aureola]
MRASRSTPLLISVLLHHTSPQPPTKIHHHHHQQQHHAGRVFLYALNPSPKLRPLDPHPKMSVPLRTIHYPPSPSRKKISRFFPPWHPDVLAADTTANPSKAKPADATSTKSFTPITIITTITSITTVTSLSPMTTTTVITDITNTTLSPTSNNPPGRPKWHGRKNSKGLKIDITEKD